LANRVTLKDVADDAGVSYQTVSKVINRQVKISPETEARIWESVQRLQYHPNQTARNLRSQRTHLIGYSWAPSLPDQTNAILDQFLHSMAQEAEKSDYHVLCFPHSIGENAITAYQKLIDTNRVDAFVVSSVEYNDVRIAYLRQRNFPFIAFGRSNPGLDFPYVDVDGADGMRQMVEHLLSLGHRRIAALAWPVESRVGQNRMDGFLAGLSAAGIKPDPKYIIRCEGNFHAGGQATGTLLDFPTSQRPTAIVAFNDFQAMGAISAAQERGLQVGTDLAITGFDDIPMTQYLTPSLTTVRQPIREVGQRVMESLLAILDGDQSGEVLLMLPQKLIIRQSSGQDNKLKG
jgi:DNA-binding LacI/PurR family transcriptional regulator